MVEAIGEEDIAVDIRTRDLVTEIHTCPLIDREVAAVAAMKAFLLHKVIEDVDFEETANDSQLIEVVTARDDLTSVNMSPDKENFEALNLRTCPSNLNE